MKHPWMLILAGTLIAGCGEIAYKRGANADALQADQEQCRAAGGDYDACMGAHGWSVYRPGGMIATADPAQTSDTAAQTASTQSATTPEAPPLLTVSTRRDNRDSSPPVPARPSPRPYDPLTVYSVSSWWKRGGNREDLDGAAAICNRKLGEPHQLQRREGGGHRVTAALLLCLRDQGWYGLAIP